MKLIRSAKLFSRKITLLCAFLRFCEAVCPAAHLVVSPSFSVVLFRAAADFTCRCLSFPVAFQNAAPVALSVDVVAGAGKTDASWCRK